MLRAGPNHLLDRPLGDPSKIEGARWDVLQPDPLLAATCFSGSGGAERGVQAPIIIPETMRALRLLEPHATSPRFSMQDVRTPRDLLEGEVLLKIVNCGVCGSDLEGLFGKTGRRNPRDTEAGLTMGHEASGMIVKVSSEAESAGWTVGDRVTFDSSRFCCACSACASGQTNTCDSMQVYGAAPKDGYVRHGAMAEYLAVHQSGLFALPDTVSYESGAMVEPIAVGMQAIARAKAAATLAPVPFAPEVPILVVGSGLIGGLLIKSLTALGYRNVMAVDNDQSRIDLAKKCGASKACLNTINPQRFEEELPAVIRSLLQEQGGDVENRGFPYVFEVVGLAQTAAFSLAALRKGGVMVAIGNAEKDIPFPLQHLVTHGKSVVGSVAATREDYLAALKLLQSGHISVEDMITDRAPLDALPRVVATRRRDRLKIMLAVGAETLPGAGI